MDGIEYLCEAAEVCRMCVDDLTEASQYFCIDEELNFLINSLTGISIHLTDTTLPLIMCTKCYTAIFQFNELRVAWINNQERLLDIKEENGEDEEISYSETDLKEEYEREVVVETVATELSSVNDPKDEYNCMVEYIEDFELGEDSHFLADESTDQVEEDEMDASMQRSTHKTRPKSEKNKEKGKAIYQQLLKKCEECNKMIEKNRLDGHMNKHREVRPYVCDAEGCEKSFYCKLLLRLHRKSIHSGAQVACNYCSKTFPSERSLYSHELRHKNANRYECVLCNRKFNNGNSLKRHQAIHSGIREFDCEYCSSSFYRRFNLDVHIKIVHKKDKSFCCSECPKKFGYSRLLKEHVQKNHVRTVKPEPAES